LRLVRNQEEVGAKDEDKDRGFLEKVGAMIR
jgi:hypothetical protein